MVRLHDLDPARFSWRADGKVPLAEFLDQLPTEGHLGSLARAIHRQAVMVNVRSEFRDEPGRHHGVGAEVYARFSAPMREIVGVFLHKETWELLTGDARGADRIAHDEALREQIVERSNQAKQVQSRINQLSHLYVLDQLFAADLASPKAERTRWTGTVMGLTRDKVHVTFDEPPVDVKLYIDDLGRQLDSELQLSDEGASLRRANGEGLCRIGEPVCVRVDRWDPSRKRFVLHMDVP
jgi:ribonuclease R